MTLVVDTSALMAILNAEQEAASFVDLIGTNPSLISTASLLEAHCVAVRSRGALDIDRLRTLVTQLELTIIPFDQSQLEVAQEAYTQYGRGSRHRASLNMGDCFAFALAKTRGLPLLFKGDDFVHTDIKPAWGLA